MLHEKYTELRSLGNELKKGIQKKEYETLQVKILSMVKMVSELMLLEKNTEIQMKLLGVAKACEDILNELTIKNYENVDLYIGVQLSVLLEDIENKKEQEIRKLLEVIKMLKKNSEETQERLKWGYRQLIESEVVTPENFIIKYQYSEDEDIQQIVKYVKEHQKIEIFNYEFKENYDSKDIEVFRDEEAGMSYVLFMGKRMYFPASFPQNRIAPYVNSILIEQDAKSPHCYEKEGFLVQEGDIVIDAGVAEGNFALSVIDRVKKIYLIECEDGWMSALKKTFEPYQDKVVFVKKFLSDTVDAENITIDELLNGEEVNYIKMDIEGAERAALQGAEDTLKRSERLTVAACSYHKRGDESWIKEFVQKCGYQTTTTSGYMYFMFDMQAWLSMELRRGLVFAKR